MKKLVFIVLSFCVSVGFSQTLSNGLVGNSPKKEYKKKEIKYVDEDKKTLEIVDADSLTPPERENYMFVEGDTTVVESIALDEVLVVGPYKFKNRADRRRYLILKRKTEHVWPYAVMAADRLTSLNDRLATLESKSKKRKYTKLVQRYIEDEFTEQLKNLTKTEGQILVKLMYRQTGETTFNTVKELKSGWRAFWYNTTASLFNISLKEKYNPEEVQEDYLIEHILRRAFQKGTLTKQDPVIPIDFSACMSRWQ